MSCSNSNIAEVGGHGLWHYSSVVDAYLEFFHLRQFYLLVLMGNNLLSSRTGSFVSDRVEVYRELRAFRENEGEM
jgi:hypothetical protein